MARAVIVDNPETFFKYSKGGFLRKISLKM